MVFTMSTFKTILGVAASAAAISLGSIGLAQPASALPPPCYQAESTSTLTMQRFCPPVDRIRIQARATMTSTARSSRSFKLTPTTPNMSRQRYK